MKNKNVLTTKMHNALKIAAIYSRDHALLYLAGKRQYTNLGFRSSDSTRDPLLEQNKTRSLLLKSLKKMTKSHKAIALGLIRSKDFSKLEKYCKSFLGIRNVLLIRLPDIETKAESGKYLNMYKSMVSASSSHRPYKDLNKGEMVGVEIECLIPDYLDDIETLQKLFEENKIKYTQVKTDGSIRAEKEYFGAEVVVLDKIGSLENLKNATELLNSIGAKVNKSCGLHVHLDCRDLETTRQVSTRAARLGNTLQVLKQLVPESRRSNHYCALAVSRFRGSRYFAVNKVAYSKYGTIEVRLHSSTTDFNKISAWIDLVYKISRCKSLTKNKSESLQDLASKIGLDAERQAYFQSRINKFSPINPNAQNFESDDIENQVEQVA